MASRSELGHAKNVANFNVLIAFILSYLDVFKPSRSTIEYASLLVVADNAKKSMESVNNASSAESGAIAARKVAFAPLNKLITRVINSVRSTDTPTEVDNQVLTLVRKLRGTRATPKKSEEEKKALAAAGKEVNEISGSQLGFPDRLENFDKLIRLLAGISLYAPNETELKLTELTTLYNNLNALNTAAVSAELSVGRARNLRHEVLYNNKTGLVALALDTKSYIRSLFGATSKEYKQISKLKFINIKKK